MSDNENTVLGDENTVPDEDVVDAVPEDVDTVPQDDVVSEDDIAEDIDKHEKAPPEPEYKPAPEPEPEYKPAPARAQREFKPSPPREDEDERYELPAKKHIGVSSFHYDIDLDGEESYASAAQIKALEERNKKLLKQIDALEDKLYASEERRLKFQRELLLSEEEAAEHRSVLDLKDSQNVQLRKEFDEFSARLADELSKLTEQDSDRRKMEHRKAILETQVEENKRAQARLDSTLNEIEALRTKVASFIDQKGQAVSTKERASRAVSELEQKLRAEFFRGREVNKRTVTDLDSLIDAERRRGQQAIDYVRESLKAKIKQLEVQIDLNRQTDLDFKKEKRRVARELKLVNRKLEDEKSLSTLNERHIESLTKQLASLKESFDKDYQTKSSLENEIANLERETGTLTAQYNAASRINAKLNAMLTSDLNLVDEEDLAQDLPASEGEPASS